MKLYHRSKRRIALSRAELKRACRFSLFILALVFVLSLKLRYSPIHIYLWKPFQLPWIEAEVTRREKAALEYLQHDETRLSAKLERPESIELIQARNKWQSQFKFDKPLSLNETKLFDSIMPKPGHNLCIAIQSFYRQDLYALRTLASVLHAQTHPNAPSALVGVMDFDQENYVREIMRLAHPNLIILTRTQLISEYASTKLRSKVQSEKFEHNPKSFWISMQRIDYTLSLSFCHRHACSRCLVLENDVLLSYEATVKLSQAATELDDVTESWGLLRLFNSDFLHGWERTVQDIGTLVILGFAGGCLGFLVARTSQQSSFIWVSFGAIWTILVPLLLGKQHLPLLGRYHPNGLSRCDKDGSVSSLGHLYPKYVVLFLLDQLTLPCCIVGIRKVIDLFVGDTLLAGGGELWELIPNVVQHIGVRSSFTDVSIKSSKGWHPYFISSDTFDSESTPF